MTDDQLKKAKEVRAKLERAKSADDKIASLKEPDAAGYWMNSHRGEFTTEQHKAVHSLIKAFSAENLTTAEKEFASL